MEFPQSWCSLEIREICKIGRGSFVCDEIVIFDVVSADVRRKVLYMIDEFFEHV